MQIRYEADHCRSAAYDGEQRVGVAEYAKENGAWVITHTEVDPAYGGQGIARKLVEALIEAARRDGAKIVPVCSYAEKMMRGKEAYADVLADRAPHTKSPTEAFNLRAAFVWQGEINSDAINAFSL